MLIEDLEKQYKLIEIFCSLVRIPSPSKSEDALIEWISVFLNANKIGFELDNYKNIIIKIPANSTIKQPILLSAHMDVVGDFSPVNLVLNNDFIETDKTRTLGADNKAGVACALLLALELTQNYQIKHGGLEIVLTRDEEHGMSGIKNLDYKRLKSKYVLVLDSDKLGQLLTSGASYINMKLEIKTKFGGHSGLDINDKSRFNAAKLIAEIINEIPQGAYYEDNSGVITSINLGTIIAGDIQNSAAKIADEKLASDNYLQYFMDNSITNVINTQAQATYSIRSADSKKENELKNLIFNIIKRFNEKYDKLAKADVTFTEHLPRFEKSSDEKIAIIHARACNKLGITQDISSFHAGAETHIYAQNSNAQGEKFLPFLVGMADIFNMHSNDEKVNQKTLLVGYDLLKELFNEFNN